MKERKGEKIGWIGGWLGSFIWLCLLSIIWLIQGKTISGVSGISLFLAAVLSILVLAPWRHPGTKYWKLMLPIYMILIASAGLYIWLESVFSNAGVSWWSILYLTPLLIPFATIGTRCWNDGNTRQN